LLRHDVPNLLRLRLNQPCTGSVFTVRLESVGIGVQSTDMQINREKWRECEQCPDYRHCYDLSAGTFLVQQAIWKK
jgi:hypothetical protein